MVSEAKLKRVPLCPPQLTHTQRISTSVGRPFSGHYNDQRSGYLFIYGPLHTASNVAMFTCPGKIRSGDNSLHLTSHATWQEKVSMM